MKQVLVVDDEYWPAVAVADALDTMGAAVVGPARTVAAAMALLGSVAVDAAVLDINLADELSFPVADALAEQGTPFVFVTGYDGAKLPASHSQVPVVEKPLDPKALWVALDRVA